MLGSVLQLANFVRRTRHGWRRLRLLAIKMCSDPITGEHPGVFQNPLSVDNGVRAYSASAYYSDSVSKRSNLHLLTETLVEKIVWGEPEDDSGQLRATGVKLTSACGTKAIRARKEVIVACGAVKSPQLLELSGIGDRRLLARHGIAAVYHNTNVGENLQDLVLASISLEVADDQISGDVTRNPEVADAVLKQYHETRKGPLSGTPLSFAYTPLVSQNGTIPRDDVEELLRESLDSVLYKSSVPSLARQYEVLRNQLLDPSESTIEFMYIPLQLNGNPCGGTTDMTKLFSKAHDGNYITLVTMLMHPFSRGGIHIASADAREQPFVDPRYLEHPLDVELLARAIKFVEKIASTEPLAGMLKTGGRRIPAVADSGGGLEEARRIVRERLFTAFHPSGTCAMLPREQGGVVDGQLRVYGTKNVRVVDASIFPIEPLGHVQSTVYAVAEKAADLIKPG